MFSMANGYLILTILHYIGSHLILNAKADESQSIFDNGQETDHRHVYSYNNKSEFGPDHWKNWYPKCAGSRQSPINIEKRKAIQLTSMQPIRFLRYTMGEPSFVLRNLGTMVELEAEGMTQKIKGGGMYGTFTLYRIHFHWARGADTWAGSEHSVDGYHYPLEIHLLHWNSDKYSNFAEAVNFDDGLAVLAVFVQLANVVANKTQGNITISETLKTIFSNMLHITKPEEAIELPRLTYGSLYPKNKSYFVYKGSLTMPPCSESVTWIIFKNPIYSTKDLIIKLKSVRVYLSDSPSLSRPIQPNNDRTIYTCCDK